MEITLLAFANSSDEFGFSSRRVMCEPHDTPLSIVTRIAPQVSREFLRVAIDSEFATWETPVGDARELAFLPPVSGG
ncbi:MAG: MoaD/ThiS family protein [Luteolibacter sp.]